MEICIEGSSQWHRPDSSKCTRPEASLSLVVPDRDDRTLPDLCLGNPDPLAPSSASQRVRAGGSRRGRRDGGVGNPQPRQPFAIRQRARPVDETPSGGGSELQLGRHLDPGASAVLEDGALHDLEELVRCQRGAPSHPGEDAERNPPGGALGNQAEVLQRGLPVEPGSVPDVEAMEQHRFSRTPFLGGDHVTSSKTPR